MLIIVFICLIFVGVVKKVFLRIGLYIVEFILRWFICFNDYFDLCLLYIFKMFI